MRKYIKFSAIPTTILLCAVSFSSASSGVPVVEIGEPHYSIVDRNNVNLASGLLYYKINDVSIGNGELSLSHHITINANDAVNLEAYISGYKDKYRGGIRKTVHTNEASKFFEVIQVSDHEGTYDFIINAAGAFEGVSGKLEQLTVAADSRHYILTKRNGTRVFFYSKTVIPSTIAQSYSPYASMVKIEESNGLITTIHKIGNGIGDRITSVNTNNGLQLKYIYEVHSRPLEVSKQGATSNPNVVADSLNWSSNFPTKIIALNNAVESCPISGDSCTLANIWPEVRYYWPDGMPRAMYIGQSVFKVVDATGLTTEFFHTAIDTQQNNPSPMNPGTYFFPRITRVKNNQGVDITYSYINSWDITVTPPIYSIGFSHQGALNTANNHGVITNYYLINGGSEVEQGAGRQVWTTGGYKALNSVNLTKNQYLYNSQANLSVPYKIDAWDSIVHFDKDFANKVNKIESKLNGVVTDYIYDTHGRLSTIDVDGRLQKITYPYSYTGFCDNYKFCHKVASVSSWHLQGQNQINVVYQYHPESGQIASTTYPANSEGKVAKNFFNYTQYYARYKNESGSMITSLEPIWLLSSEYFCKNSSMSGTNCTENDKVTISYEYGSGSEGNNLFLLGQKTTAQGESTIWTTCYKYDKYGNQIELSKPKSGILDCNVGREY